MSAKHPPNPREPRPGDNQPGGRRRGEQPDRVCRVLSREAVRRVDRVAVERFGIPSIVLMENAAIALRDRALVMMDRLATDRAVILAGPGNNGGDGLALARHLHIARMKPSVLLTGDPGRPATAGCDAAVNLGIIRHMGLPIRSLSDGPSLAGMMPDAPVLLVDAMLGTGLSDAAREPIASIIRAINRARSRETAVLAVDVPSGLDCDSGLPAGGGPAVEADATVTFVALKPGMLHLDAQRWTGEVTVGGIGVPQALIDELGELVADNRRGPAPEPGVSAADRRPPDTHGRAADREG